MRRGDGTWLIVFLVLVVGAKVDVGDAAERSPKATARVITRSRPASAPPLAAPAWRGGCAPLQPATIRAFARRAGFTDGEATIATAVARAESDGRPCAHNPVPPDDSYCLMQINMLGQLGPARRAAYRLRRNTDLYDPATCMRVAYAISGGGSDWTPWTTYTRGTYRAFLGRG